jgi:serine/threonine-protein kinase
MSEDFFTDRYLIERVVLERDFVTRSVAVDRLLGREVLITHLTGQVGRRAAVQERFRDAARKAVRLSHVNIVALYDIGTANGFPYSVQEHTHSEVLTEIIAHEGPFHPDDVIVLVEQVAAALDYAALRDLYHLALSPAAITVDYGGQVLVSDFGIGRVLNDISPTDVAKLRYRAPEQMTGAEGDARSDVFSLGVIAYEMLTGRPPFDITSVEALRTSVAEAKPKPLSAIDPNLSASLSSIVIKSLADDPDHRFQSAGHFADALLDWSDPDRTTGPVYETSSIRSVDATLPIQIAPEPEPESADLAPFTEEEHGQWPRGTAVAAWLTVAIALVALTWIGMRLLRDDNSSGNQAAEITPTALSTSTVQAVPTAISLVGMTVDQASASTNFRIRVVGTETSDTVPAGQIIRQSPNAGNPVRTGELIVVISDGPTAQPIQLSDIQVQGTPFDQVAQQLTGQGLNVSQVQEGSQSVPEGQVIRIDEQSANPGDTVHVVVSMGDMVQIPADLQSKPLDEAVSQLKDLGLNVGEPIAVSKSRIESFQVNLDELGIVDGDVVGIQEEGAGFGAWVPRGSTVTPVYYDASLTS